MSKHTPGPWTTDGEYITWQDADEIDYTLASVHLNREANANLIASAPELFEACKELLTYINADNELKVSMYPQSIELAKHAIAKAEGK